MEVRAVTKYVRISPQKANEVARLIRGMSAAQALDTLKFIPRKAARLIRKTLQSAVANAENNAQLAVEDLVVKQAVVGCGPSLKRGLAVARGSWHPILKRTSHIQIVLSDEEAARRSEARAVRAARAAAAPKPAAAPSGAPSAETTVATATEEKKA